MENRIVSLLACLLAVLVAAWFGTGFQGGEWYSALIKPAWNLPFWAFTLAWPAFYLLMALAAWRLWADDGRSSMNLLAGWLLQLALVIGWFWLLFSWHRPGWALAEMTLLVILTALNVMGLQSRSPRAGKLMAVCLVWLGFVWAWNLAIWRLHGGGLESIMG
jgi:tryptophan-rich sensory protein